MPLPSKPESGHFFSEELWKTSGVSPLEIERANIEIFLSEARKYLDEKDVESLSGQLYSNANRLHPASSWERKLSKMALKYEAHQAPVPSEFNDVPHPALDKANVYDAIVYLSKRLKSIPDVPHLSKQDYLHYLGPDCRDEVYIYALLAIHEWMLHFRDPKNGRFEMEIFSPSEAKASSLTMRQKTLFVCLIRNTERKKRRYSRTKTLLSFLLSLLIRKTRTKLSAFLAFPLSLRSFMKTRSGRWPFSPRLKTAFKSCLICLSLFA
jgi:hypothetical protein